ncbi:MAG TPA: helix-turn-helix domain-containing protein, partial [Candidatus Thermoplasmatota archaeon]|nr:helix-turn-helix domain-containing protein [Candidatus Thermoplasmatota archaeon]
RVFYPVEGGLKARETSRAIANLRNANALRIFEALERRPGVGSGDLVRELGLHGGTARWHLRRMRDAGLLEELVGASASRLFPTELGRRALQAAQGERTTPAAPKPVAFPGLNAASAGGDS